MGSQKRPSFGGVGFQNMHPFSELFFENFKCLEMALGTLFEGFESVQILLDPPVYAEEGRAPFFSFLPPQPNPSHDEARKKTFKPTGGKRRKRKPVCVPVR